MTIDQFDDQQFGKGMRGVHKDMGFGKITDVDFSEKLICIMFDDNRIIGESWCRCENIEMAKEGE